jgi:hypothetical protein
MDPQSYAQLMIQQLMGAGTAAPGMGGQNASTPYGAAFMTGNQMAPNSAMAPQAQQGQMPQGMMGQAAPSASLQQPMATYPTAAQ